MVGASLKNAIESSKFFVPLFDSDLPRRYMALLTARRKFANEVSHQAYRGPVAWFSRGGFDLKSHAPQLGLCHKGLRHMKDRLDPVSNEHRILFWTPLLLPESVNRTIGEQGAAIKAAQALNNFPSYHQMSFGRISDQVGLFLTYLELYGNIPFSMEYSIRTDTLWEGTNPVCVGWKGNELDCSWWRTKDRYLKVGVVPMGVESFT